MGPMRCTFWLVIGLLSGASCVEPPVDEPVDDVEPIPPCIDLDESIIINSDADSDVLAAVCTITGDVVVTSGVTRVSLPRLVTVDGDFTLAGDGTVRELVLPSLTSLGGYLDLGQFGGRLTSLSLPSLETAGFIAAFNLPLESVDLPALVRLRGLSIVGTTEVTRLALPSLVEVGTLDISDHGAVAVVEAPLLVRAGSIFMLDLPPLCTVSLPSLTTVDNLALGGELTEYVMPLLTGIGGDLESYTDDTRLVLPLLERIAGSLVVRGRDLALPSLVDVGGSVDVIRNDRLESLFLPVLAAIGEDLTVLSNPALRTVSLPALVTVARDLHVSNGPVTRLALPSLVEVAGTVFVSSLTPPIDCSGDFIATTGDCVQRP